MRLFEFSGPAPVLTKLVTVADQLKTDLDSGDTHPTWTVDQLLDYFRQYDIPLDVTDLYNMIKLPPLNKIIDNIQGDDVIFKGQEDTDAPPDKNKEIVKSMAQDAAKKFA